MKKTIEVFKQNIKQNGAEKLSEWLYAECLELSAAVMAYKLDPTQKHKEEICEEIADVKLLLTQYRWRHNVYLLQNTQIDCMDYIDLKTIAIGIVNAGEELIYTSGETDPTIKAHVRFSMNQFSSLIDNYLDALVVKVADSEVVCLYYNKKLERLKRRLGMKEQE